MFLFFTVLFALLLLGVLLSVAGKTFHGDAAFGQGLAWVYAIILVTLTWLSMAGLLTKAATQGLLPEWTSTAAIILWPASALAAGVSFYLMNSTLRWPIVIPVSIPLLFSAYVIALSVPSLRPPTAANSASLAIWGLLAILSLAPWPATLYKLGEGERKAAAWKAEMDDPVKKAQRRAAGLAKLETMTPDMPLEEWTSLLEPDTGTRAEALEVLRTADRRQEDMERLLRNGPFYVALVPELDLKATPSLCQLMQDRLWDISFAMQLQGERGNSVLENPVDAEFAVLPWFRARGCDCSRSLDYMADKVHQYYKDSPERKEFIERLTRLKQTLQQPA